MDGIAKTAFYCCGVRAQDARSARPLCGDHLAQLFMDGEAEEYFAHFKEFEKPNASNATRHRLVDDLLRERLSGDAALCVVLLGAGFDTRAFRLAGGTWWEFDNPEVIQRKQAVLAQEQAPNPLTRIPIDFSSDSLQDKLAPLRGVKPAIVIMEGVSMYLEHEALLATLATLKATLPGHTLVCDLMTFAFSKKYSDVLDRIVELGGHFAVTGTDQAPVIIGQGYRLLSRQSIPATAMRLVGLPPPFAWVLARLMRTLCEGYQMHVFQAE